MSGRGVLYALKLILDGSVEFEFAGIAVERFRLAASHRMARVVQIMTTTTTAMAIEPAVELAREKPLTKSADVGGFVEGRGREWMRKCYRG